MFTLKSACIISSTGTSLSWPFFALPIAVLFANVMTTSSGLFSKICALPRGIVETLRWRCLPPLLRNRVNIWISISRVFNLRSGANDRRRICRDRGGKTVHGCRCAPCYIGIMRSAEHTRIVISSHRHRVFRSCDRASQDQN